VTAAFERTATAMGTVVTIRLVGGIAAERPVRTQRALDWFSRVEACCSRFDPSSELRRMVHHAGHPFAASEILFEATRFAIAVARASDGAFDPTIGTTMESRGFDVSWQSGERTPSRLPIDAVVSWRDVEIDEAAHTITLHRPLVLDLGAVAKGLLDRQLVGVALAQQAKILGQHGQLGALFGGLGQGLARMGQIGIALGARDHLDRGHLHGLPVLGFLVSLSEAL